MDIKNFAHDNVCINEFSFIYRLSPFSYRYIFDKQFYFQYFAYRTEQC